MQSILIILASVLSAVFLVSFPVRSADLKMNENFSINFIVLVYLFLEFTLFIAYCASLYLKE